MDSGLINIILTNVFVTGLISTLVSFFVSVKLKDLDFRNEYYKQIVERRLEAYQNLEIIISELKGIVLDTEHPNSLPYHMFMSEGEDGYYKFLNNFMHSSSDNLWLDDTTNDVLEKLNQITFVIGNEIKEADEEQIVEIGKKYYNLLSEIRFNLENSMKDGLYNLHNVKKALKVKKNRKVRVLHSKIDV